MTNAERGWLHREGDWFLLGREHWPENMERYTHRKSLIWHECQKRHHLPSNWKGCWRIANQTIPYPCPRCYEHCPPGIAALFRLHNWDTLDMYDY